MSHLADLIQTLQCQHPLERADICAAMQSALAEVVSRQHARSTVSAHIDAEGAVEVLLDGHPLKPDDALIGHDADEFARRLDAKLRQLAAENTWQRYTNRAGKLVSGTVEGVSLQGITVRLSDGAAGVIPPGHLPPGESPRPGERLQAVVFGVSYLGLDGAVVKLSATRPELVARYLEEAVPEIADGKIVIERVAREAGYRAKVLLRSTQPKLDALACAAGTRGARLAALSERLGGEKVDLIEYSADPHEVCAAALSPAKVDEVLALPLAACLVAIVPEGQELLARGRRDKNLWLASQLCGMDIRVRTRQDHELSVGAALVELVDSLGLDEVTAGELAEAGIHSIDDLELTDADEICQATGMALKRAAEVMGKVAGLTGYVSS